MSSNDNTASRPRSSWAQIITAVVVCAVAIVTPFYLETIDSKLHNVINNQVGFQSDLTKIAHGQNVISQACRDKRDDLTTLLLEEQLDRNKLELAWMDVQETCAITAL